MDNILKKLRWCTDASETSGFQEVSLARRQLLSNLHFNYPEAASAWPIIHNYVQAAPIEFKVGGEMMRKKSTRFQYMLDEFFTPIKNRLFHDICIQGVAVIVLMVTQTGDIIPKIVPLETYQLFVGYSVESETREYVAQRIVQNRKNATSSNVVRPDLAMDVEDGADSLSFVVDGFGFDPGLDGSINSIVESYANCILEHERVFGVFVDNLEATRNPQLIAEFVPDRNKDTELHSNMLVDPGSTNINAEDMFEAGANAARLQSMLMEKRRQNGLVPPALGPGHNPRTPTTNRIRRDMQHEMNVSNVRMLPGMVRLVETSTKIRPAEWGPVRDLREIMRANIARMYGVSGQSTMRNARAKADEKIYASETEGSINRWVEIISRALTSIYNVMYGDDQLRLDIYVTKIRPEIIELVRKYIATEERDLQEKIAEKEEQMTEPAEDESPEQIAGHYHMYSDLRDLDRRLRVIKDHSVGIENMSDELFRFQSLAKADDYQSLRAQALHRARKNVVLYIKKRVLHETTADPQHTIDLLRLRVITHEEYISMERTRVGLHTDMARRDMSQAIESLETHVANMESNELLGKRANEPLGEDREHKKQKTSRVPTLDK